MLKLENGSQYPSDDFLERIAADAQTALQTQQVSAQTVTIDEDDYDDRYREQGYINAQTAESILAAQLGRSDLQFVEKDYDIDDGTYESNTSWTASNTNTRSTPLPARCWKWMLSATTPTTTGATT